MPLLCIHKEPKAKETSQEQPPEALLVGFGFPTRVYFIIMCHIFQVTLLLQITSINLSKKQQTRLTLNQKYVIIKATRGTPLRLSLRKPLALNNIYLKR
jgi:hypothetical protein